MRTSRALRFLALPQPRLCPGDPSSGRRQSSDLSLRCSMLVETGAVRTDHELRRLVQQLLVIARSRPPPPGAGERTLNAVQAVNPLISWISCSVTHAPCTHALRCVGGREDGGSAVGPRPGFSAPFISTHVSPPGWTSSARDGMLALMSPSPASNGRRASGGCRQHHLRDRVLHAASSGRGLTKPQACARSWPPARGGIPQRVPRGPASLAVDVARRQRSAASHGRNPAATRASGAMTGESRCGTLRARSSTRFGIDTSLGWSASRSR